MITVSQAVEQVIKKSPFIEEALFEGLINVSALARKIMPDVAHITKKKIKLGAIVMAINRLSPGDYIRINADIKSFLKSLGNILVRSGLSDYTFAYSDELTIKQTKLLKLLHQHKDNFCTFSQGVGERTIVVSTSLKKEMKQIFRKEKVLSVIENLSSVTIELPQQNVEIPGVYYYILKKLAWEGINIIEVISTTNEFTIVVNDKDVEQTFSLLMRLKKAGE
jgi:aspartokinase